MRKYILLDIMECKGMSINDVAERSNGYLTPTIIRNLMAGRTKANLKHVKGFKIALDLNNDQIFSIFL